MSKNMCHNKCDSNTRLLSSRDGYDIFSRRWRVMEQRPCVHMCLWIRFKCRKHLELSRFWDSIFFKHCNRDKFQVLSVQDAPSFNVLIGKHDYTYYVTIPLWIVWFRMSIEENKELTGVNVISYFSLFCAYTTRFRFWKNMSNHFK